MMRLITQISLGLLCACLAGIGLYNNGQQDAQSEAALNHAQALIQQNKQWRVQRTQLQYELTQTSKHWQRDVKNREQVASRTIQRLRDQSVRLSVQLADNTACHVSGRDRSDADDRAEVHPDAAQFLIQQAQQADQQVTALQASLRTLQAINVEDTTHEP